MRGSYAQLTTALESIIGPVQISQTDILAAQGDLAHNGFMVKAQEIFSNLSLSHESINNIVNTLLVVNPADIPTNLFVALRQLAKSYGEVAEITSCVAGVCVLLLDIQKIEIEANEFEVKGHFTLVPSSNGIDPFTEDVKLQVGSFSTTIPAGLFRLAPAKPGKKGKPGKPAEFKFEGLVGEVSLEVKITPLAPNTFEFKAEGKGADLTGTVNPINIRLTIGDDTGMASVDAKGD